MLDFEFPANIRQMGNIGDGMRIYVEDYVYTYMQQYAEAGGYTERLGVLVGRYMTIDDQKVLLISGVLQATDVKTEKGLTLFTEGSWETCRADIRKYFKGLDMVGWMQSQPGYGVALNAGYAKYHKNNFTNPYQVLFVIDPIEKMNVFYYTDELTSELKEAKGYFIYYDKNQNMHEYMLDNKIRSEKVSLKSEPAKTVKVEMVENPITPESQWQKPIYSKKTELYKPKRYSEDQKRIVNMLVPLSAVLLLICFIMGAGLIQSDGRISSLEGDFTALSKSYDELFDQFKDIKTAAVFALQDPKSEDTDYELRATLTNEDGNKNLIENQATPTPISTPPPESTPISPPESTPTPAPVTEDNSSLSNVPDTYTVEAGDSLGYISLKFYGNYNMVDKIMELNGISDPDSVWVGSVLKLP